MDILPGFKLCRKGLHQYPETDARCKECQKKWNKEWRKANQKQHLENNKKWYYDNKEKVLERRKKWYLNNRERDLQRRKKWSIINQKQEKQRQKQWAKTNSAKKNHQEARRRAAKKRATPSWADLNAIKKIYEEAARLTKETKMPHEVDHIYPLQNKYMCGLHVENNLQILTKSENRAKGNRTWPGQLECQKT